MYYLVYGLFYLLSLLPLRVLYLFTDFFYLVIYYVAGYRKEVVMQNLVIAFPEKTLEERKKIAKRFYRNFTDFFAETIKLFSANDAFLEKHFVPDLRVFERLKKEGRKCQVHLGHNFNWELGYLACVSRIDIKVLGVYMPLSSF
jgi:Kdo2-lipid IVA lauroyltransferase/acyltransferase